MNKKFLATKELWREYSDLIIRTVASYLIRNARGEDIIDNVIIWKKTYNCVEGKREAVEHFSPQFWKNASQCFDLDLHFLLGYTEEQIQKISDHMGW